VNVVCRARLVPSEFTRQMLFVVSGANRIRLPGPQVPPRPLEADAITRAGPPSKSTRLSWRSAKKQSERLSGDQNGYCPLVVPAIGRAVAELKGRAQICESASDADATNARVRPSGETAN
jgi:hypothetical protein